MTLMENNILNKELIRESIFVIGHVLSVEGRIVTVKVNKNKNHSHIVYEGKTVKNVSVGSYIKIVKGFINIIGKVEGESIEDIFAHVQKIFETYNLDPLYFHLNLVFEFLRLEYYNHYKVYRQAEKYYEEVNDAAGSLLVNYPSYTFSVQFFVTRLERSLRLGLENEMYAENERILTDIEPDPQDLPKHIIFILYKALGCYYVEKYDEAAKLINNLINEVSLKRFPLAQMEIKAFLALLYCLTHDFELFNQHSSSIQRQIRMFGKDECENVLLFLKILKIATSEAKKEKPKKIAAFIPKFKEAKVNYFSPTSFIKMDEAFIKRLTAIESE